MWRISTGAGVARVIDARAATRGSSGERLPIKIFGRPGSWSRSSFELIGPRHGTGTRSGEPPNDMPAVLVGIGRCGGEPSRGCWASALPGTWETRCAGFLVAVWAKSHEYQGNARCLGGGTEKGTRK